MLSAGIWIVAPAAAGQARPGPTPKVAIDPRPNRPDPAEPDAPRANIRVDTTLVLIPVTVTDPLNRFVTGLEKEHFRLFEDKVEQKISAVFAARTRRFRSGVVFDTSGSMGNKLQKSRQAVAQFFKTANPEDEFFLVQFNDRPELVDGLHHEHWRRSRTG